MKRIFFFESVSDILETWKGQNIFSVKWQKWLILIKKSELKKKENGKDNGNLQDMCKNHQDSVTWNTRGGLATEKTKTKTKQNQKKKKKEEFATYIICGLQ